MLVMEFLERLRRWHVLAVHRDANGQPTHFEATGYPLGKAETDYQQGRLELQALEEQRRTVLEAHERQRQAARERGPSQMSVVEVFATGGVSGS